MQDDVKAILNIFLIINNLLSTQHHLLTKSQKSTKKISREVAKIAYSQNPLSPSVVSENDINNLTRRFPLVIKGPVSIKNCDEDYLDIGNYLMSEMGLSNINKDKCKGMTDKAGYTFPKRSIPGHICNQEGSTILTKDKYMKKFRQKGAGTAINQIGNGVGQSFMIYPVYDTLDSNKDDFKYYIHSINMRQIL